MRRSRFLVEVHDAPGSGRHGRAAELVEGWWVRRFGARALSHSRSVHHEVDRRWRPPTGRSFVFPLGIDTSVMTPTTSKPPEDGPTLVAVGRLVPSKRFDLAIEVTAALVSRFDVRLTIVGQGPEREHLERRAEQLGVAGRLRFVGARFGDELADTIRDADVLVSTSEYEGFGLTVVEAMACATPVVAMDAGGVSELLAHGGGDVVPRGDVAAMAERIAALLESDPHRRSVGEIGRGVAEERFSVPVMAERFAELYERLATSR